MSKLFCAGGLLLALLSTPAALAGPGQDGAEPQAAPQDAPRGQDATERADQKPKGGWFDRAKEALEEPAPSPAPAAAEETLDPDALVNIADKTSLIAMGLGEGRTSNGIVGDQIEVESDLDALIAMLEKKGS